MEKGEITLLYELFLSLKDCRDKIRHLQKTGCVGGAGVYNHDKRVVMDQVDALSPVCQSIAHLLIDAELDKKNQWKEKCFTPECTLYTKLT